MSRTKANIFLQRTQWLSQLAGFGIFILSLLWVELGCAYEIDLDLPVASQVGGAAPDLFTGTMGARIPIDVPKGRRGIEPNLALVYRGGNGNGPTGVGWKLDMGGIERQSRFGVDFSGSAYVLKLNGAVTDLVPDPTVTDQYWAKIQGDFLRVQKRSLLGVSYWDVTDRKGTLYRFGYTWKQTDPADATRIFRWALEWVVDGDANSMSIDYFKNEGQLYLETIMYTWNNKGAAQPTSPLFAIKVKRIPSGSPTTLYTTGFPVKTNYLVGAISVEGGNRSIRAYKLAYTPSPQSSLSLLQTVTQYGKDAVITTANDSLSNPVMTGMTGTSLPPTALTYSADSSPSQFVDQGIQPSSPCASGSPMGTADFNGDGRGDVWCHEYAGSAPTYVALSTGTGQLSAWIQVMSLGWCAPGYYFTTGDANGDGLADLICHGNTMTFVLLNTLLSNGIPSFTHPPDAGVWRQNWCPAGNNGNPSGAFGVGDFDGDGRTDIRCYDGGVKVQVSNGSAFVNVQGGQETWRSSWCTSGTVFGTADFNGDGKADIFCRTGGDYRVSLSNGIQFVVGPNGDLWRSNWCAGTQFNGVADFNGDGKADWYCRVENSSGPMWVQLSTGSAFVAGASGDQWQAGWCWSGAQVGVGDFNGDGKADMYCHGSAATWIGLSTGQAFVFTTSEGKWKENWCPDGALFAVRDFNGDGKADLWCHQQGAMSVALSGSSPGPADALLTLANGLGGLTTVGYSYYTPQAGQGAPFTLSLVGSLTTTDGNGVTAPTTYTYSGGYYHVAQREFRGFSQVTITGPPGPQGLASEQRKTTILFHQGDNLDLTNTQSAQAYMRGKPYKITVSDGNGNKYQERTITYGPGKGSTPYVFNPPLILTDTTCDGTACTKFRTTTYTYDEGYPGEYGNITKEVHSGTGTTSRTLTRQYDPNTSTWTVSLPFQETVYEGEGTGGTVKSQTVYTYDFAINGGCNSTTTVGGTMPNRGNVRSITHGVSPATSSTFFTYSWGMPTCKRDPRGNVWKFFYGLSNSQINAVEAPDGQTTSSTFNECVQATCTGLDATSPYGFLTLTTGSNAEITSFEYDVFGRPTKQTVQVDEAGPQAVTITAYPAWGTVGQQRVETTDPAGLLSVTYFDGFQRTFKQTRTGPDNTMLVQKTQYDPRGLVRFTSVSSLGQETQTGTTFSYDLLGRPTTTVQSDGSTLKACEDDWARVTIDPRGLRLRQVRDAFGRVTLVEESNTINTSCDTSSSAVYASMTFQYDAVGNQLVATDIRGNRVEQDYDILSRRTELRDPDLGRWLYQYDAAGNVSRQIDARNGNTVNSNNTIYFQYDSMNRLIQQDYNVQRTVGDVSADVIYKYGEASIDGVTLARGKGRLTTRMEVNGNQAQFVYDRIGRVIRRIQTIDGQAKRTWFTYDGLDRPSSVKYDDNAIVNYEYNGPWLKRVYEGGVNYAQFAGFTPMGQPGMLTFGNGVVTQYTYGIEGGGSIGCAAASFRLCTMLTTKGATILQNLGYSYDVNGNVTGITDPTIPNGNQSYTYDNNDRIMHASGPAFNYDHGVDNLGNLTFWPVVAHYAYPSSGPGIGHHPHAVCATGWAVSACNQGTQYTYDSNGNMTGGVGRTLSYDTANRLTGVTMGAGTTTFVYDGDGGRVKKTRPGGTAVTYYGQWLECEQGLCTKYIWANGQRLAMKQVSTGAVTYFHPNHLGSTDRVTNGTTGVQEERIDYYPFGEQWQDLNQPANVPYKYTGQEYDASTGLYFYKSRYYDAHLGRFIQPDTVVPKPLLPQSWNRYSYVMNNPLKYADPTGHSDEIPNSQDWSFANGSFTPDLGVLTGYVYSRVGESSKWTSETTTTSVNSYYNVINGMSNTTDQARDNGIRQVVGFDTTATQFTLWHNPSEGFFLDLMESIADKVGFTTQIAKETASLLRSNPDSLWFLHSQGSLIFSSAVSYLNEQGVSLSNVSAVFNGAAANHWVTGAIMAKAGVSIKEWNGHPGDFVHDVIGFNTVNPLRFIPAILMAPTMWIPGASEHCCYP